ncbi:MAG: flagellar basal body rod C-terminal domain-containing protein [Cypionkella sp.]
MSNLAISNGISGLQKATARFEASAGKITRGGAGLEPVDMAGEMVNIIEAKFDFTANTKVVRAISDMQKSAIDILA